MTTVRDALLLRVVMLGLRVVRSLRHRAGQLMNVVEAAALAGLSKGSLQRITVAAYDRMGTYNNETGLFGWEKEWFAADLPSPPARILIGGAGSGREIAPLEAAGYKILAFDPAPNFVRHARSLASIEAVEFVEASYENLASGAGAQAAPAAT